MKASNELESELSWIGTRNHLVTIRYRGLLLHSVYDPVREAEKMVLPLVRENPGFVVICGLGLSYHVKALRQGLEGVEILVYEPCEEIYQAAIDYNYGDWQNDPNIQVYNDLEVLEDALINRCIYSDQGRFPLLWIYSPYRRLAPVQVAHFETLLQNLKLRQASNTKTLREKVQLWLQNIETNWQWLLKLPNISKLHRGFEQMPCVIVASGPSLSLNYSVLRQMEGQAILFASGSVYAWLKRKGIHPHMVAILEGEDVSAELTANTKDDRTWVALASSTHPNHFRKIGGRRLVFDSERWLAKLLGQEPFVPHGGNVASAAFTMALIMGCNPIILMGQDLSHEGDMLHAKGLKNRGEEEALKYRRFPMEGQRRVVYGQSAMVSYLSWYEESARYLARVRPDLLLINATEGGARIRGFEEMSLDEARKKYCREKVEIHGILQKRLSDVGINVAVVKERLYQMQQDLIAMENHELRLRDSLAAEFYNWFFGGDFRPENIGKAQEFVGRFIEKTDYRSVPPGADLEEHFV